MEKPKFNIPSVRGSEGASRFPRYEDFSRMQRMWAWSRMTLIHELQSGDHLVRQYRNDYEDENLSETELLVQYARDINEFWADFEQKFKGALKLPAFSVHVGELADGTPGVIMVIEKIKPYNPSNETEIEEKLEKCQSMWQGFVKYLQNCEFYKNRAWWDNKSDQFVYGTVNGDAEPDWYLVDLDLKTQEYTQEKSNSSEGLRYKYVLSLDGFYQKGNVRPDFYTRIKNEIESAVEGWSTKP